MYKQRTPNSCCHIALHSAKPVSPALVAKAPAHPKLAQHLDQHFMVPSNGCETHCFTSSKALRPCNSQGIRKQWSNTAGGHISAPAAKFKAKVKQRQVKMIMPANLFAWLNEAAQSIMKCHPCWESKRFGSHPFGGNPSYESVNRGSEAAGHCFSVS